jgi:hypothetical protein
MPVFAYFEKDRKSAENFNRAMTSFSTVETPTIAKAYDFSGIRSLTDIGGGHGPEAVKRASGSGFQAQQSRVMT